jgi:5'-nucleotidase (lipoprotein e(P4) family)
MSRMYSAFAACLLIASAVAVAADSDDAKSRELLGATLWMQRAPEARALAEQVYRIAREKISAMPQGSAAVEQAGIAPDVLARMPPAIVMDLDETVLDNTVFQARLLRDRRSFNAKDWGTWVASGAADEVPGARDFIQLARKLGYTVFYISNRDCSTPAATVADPCPAKTATMRNLVELGIDAVPDPGRMLLRGEQPDWVAGKSARRAFIAANYRIVALVGDDLGDFVDPPVFAGDRARLEPNFGSRWFLLPNPIYGSWTGPYDDLSEKYAGLRIADPVITLPGLGPWPADSKQVRVASWNIEYLITEATHLGLRNTCAQDGGRVGGDDRTLPCDITRRTPRGPDDYASLRHYATQLAADIVALQEVDGPDAAELVFPGYDFCFSTRGHTQKNGFAIRHGLPHRCESEYEPLSVNNAVRRGVVVTFFPDTVNEFRLMSVHLKSGCPVGPMTEPTRNCELLSKQVAPLEAWIEDEARAGHRFGVLGDFNRRLTIEKGPAKDAQGRQLNLLAELNDGDPPASKLLNVTGREKFTPCTSDSEYREFIDNILLGRDLARDLASKSFIRVVFNDQDAKAHWLSDHCPVGIGLRLH